MDPGPNLKLEGSVRQEEKESPYDLTSLFFKALPWLVPQ